jgi:3-methyladenine DNA glycosylase AlkD
MPYLGVRVPEVRKITRAQARARPPSSVAALGQTAAALWREATHREERYAATGLTGLTMAVGQLELLPLHQEMIVTGAWWDHVDEVAHRVGDLLLVHPDQVRPVIRAWSHESDLWLRRVSIIAQLGAKARTDVALLSDAINANTSDRDFFIRKAIGWALREYARTDPEWVRRFVAAHADELSPLSQREALKHLGSGTRCELPHE